MSDDTYPIPAHGWTCFHCGDTFTTPGSARDHFGFEPSSDPACRIKLGAERGLIKHIRECEAEIERLMSELHHEGAEGLKGMRAMMSRHASQFREAEEAGYEKGLAGGRALDAARREALDLAISLIESAERETNWVSGDPYGDSATVGLRAVLKGEK